MRQGKYTVVNGKYVHSSDLCMVRIMQVVKGICAAIVVVALGYMASFCI
jgi:hypothetical protein